MVFESARNEGYPTHYGNQHSAANADVLLSGIICAIVILAVSLIFILPAFSGWKRKLKMVAHISAAMFVGSVIITGNFGHNWEVGKVSIVSPYKGATAEEIKGELGIHVSLRGVNITLQGEAKNPNGELAHETIDYNENFSWVWAQGRFGFGYYAGRISRDFRAAVLRGVPLPILQLAEYFTFDGEGLRFGRYYRWAGWYSHLLMWAAFPAWFLSLIFFRTVVSKGAALMMITGALQATAIIIWSTLRNKLEVVVPFESEDGTSEVMLKTKYGYDYYLVLVNSLLCLLGGGTIFIANIFYPEKMCNIFDIDVQTLYQDVVLSNEEFEAEIEELENPGPKQNSVILRLKSFKTKPVADRSSTVPLDKDDLVVVRRKRGTSYLASPSQRQSSAHTAARRRRAHTREVSMDIEDSVV